MRWAIAKCSGGWMRASADAVTSAAAATLPRSLSAAPGPSLRVFAAGRLFCGGRRSVVAVVVDYAIARAVLAALGLPCTPGDLRACAGATAGRVLVRRRFVAQHDRRLTR